MFEMAPKSIICSLDFETKQIENENVIERESMWESERESEKNKTDILPDDWSEKAKSKQNKEEKKNLWKIEVVCYVVERNFLRYITHLMEYR